MTTYQFTAKNVPTRWTRGIIWAATLLAMTVQAQEAEQPLMAKARQLFNPLPQDMATKEFPITPARAALGRKLFSIPGFPWTVP
jgi:cytochrome c peroxidase